VLEKSSARFSTKELSDAVPETEDGKSGDADVAKDKSMADELSSSSSSPLDYEATPKHIVLHEESLPSAKEATSFNHQSFFSNLHHYALQSHLPTSPSPDFTPFGHFLLYGEVVTSTSTLLEKNPSLLRLLPTGFTCTATTQVAGRGRGSNVWVSPPGSLMFSTVIKHPMALSQKAPVVFAQYIAALAVVYAVKSYAAGYGKIPVKLKWPNDIYALDPAAGNGKAGTSATSSPNDRDKYVKIGGILVNSSYSGTDYTLTVGIGLNVANAAPTTGLNALAASANLEPFQHEKLLARILTCFEAVYQKFCCEGWSRELEEEYYGNWLHSEQIVTLEAEGGVRARIKGVTRDWGLLVAEELGWEDRRTGKTWALQSDSNSFDFFKGLVKRKV
jgi:biotin---protein ligase